MIERVSKIISLMTRTINLSSNAWVLKFTIIFTKQNIKKIEFLGTDEAETGKRKDILYTLDDKKTFHEENESTPELNHS